MERHWIEEHRENVRDVVTRCLVSCLDELAPGFAGIVRTAAEHTLLEWPEGTPPHVRAFADEETRRLIDQILPLDAVPVVPEGPHEPRRGW
tara:strand:+ start:1808 stop:2080 length:273 start_codon:yes stop_codon:yes gene_type:complete